MALGLASAIVLFTGVGVLFATQHRHTREAPSFRVTRIGGVEYESMLGRPLHPGHAVDRAIVTGLPARRRRIPAGQTLFGTFIATTNDSARPLRTADRIVLRDQSGRVYRPLSLPATNPYAYSPRMLRPGTRIPSFDSPADDNLAATGRVLVFRIPAKDYDNGAALELVIHDPSDPGATASLII